jgi:hypothetical protein
VLVPRSSGTPVATWAWPTWVVSRRRVLEAVFVLLEFSSPSRRIFIGSHSLPPSLVRRIGPSHLQLEAQRGSNGTSQVVDIEELQAVKLESEHEALIPIERTLMSPRGGE